jgi:phospholipid/cholesterol/gamma-HCH transport system substrate-binding protein
MTQTTTQSFLTRALAVVLAVALVAAVVLLVLPGSNKKTITAEFPRTVSLYDGSDVRILGVSVGKVDSVTPAGTKVIVKISYDAKYKVPADAKAALVSPSIVGDRFIQLTPVYRKGPVMSDHARLGVSRTATPLELDQIYGSLNNLSVALGPDGANKTDGTGEGALTRLLDSTARNFGGEGVQFNSTLTNLAALTQTLDNNKDNLFGTAKELETFVNTLAKNDTTVRAFNDSLSSAADLLAGERNDLAAALRNLGTALVQVRGFVKDNKDNLSRNITDLNRVAKILVNRRDAVDEVLKDAPVALNNLGLAYNPKTGTLDTRANLGEALNQLTSDPKSVVCGLVSVVPGASKTCTTALAGLPRAGALPVKSAPDDPTQYVDRSLGGLVAVSK